MKYSISTEAKYKDRVLVILEGHNSSNDGEYHTFEQTFSKDDFDSHVADELNEILKSHYKLSMPLGELEDDYLGIQFSDLGYCDELSGYEVLYYDENGVCYPVFMNF